MPAHFVLGEVRPDTKRQSDEWPPAAGGGVKPLRDQRFARSRFPGEQDGHSRVGEPVHLGSQSVGRFRASAQ